MTITWRYSLPWLFIEIEVVIVTMLFQEIGYELAHLLNAQLLDFIVLRPDGCFKKLLDSLWVPEDWIVNVLYIARVDDIADLRAVLRTSAVAYRGKLYDGQGEPDGNVGRLDQLVPTEGSVSGMCVFSQQSHWLNFSDLESSLSHPTKLYRPFGYVNIAAEKMPAAEIVFPICLKTGLVSLSLGVINFEYFPHTKQNHDWGVIDELQSRRHGIVQLIQALTSAHAGFLKIASHIGSHTESSKTYAAIFGQMPKDCRDGLLKAHQFCLQSAFDTCSIDSKNKSMSCQKIS
jgi:hypothetical protein